MIGLSLSRCIRDIIEEKVDYDKVNGIVSSCNWKTNEEIEDGVDRYARIHWRCDPVLAVAIFYTLYFQGKIIFPRTFGIEPIEPHEGQCWWHPSQ